MRALRIDAVIEDSRDMGHLALYFTMLSGSLSRRPIRLHVDLTRCPSVDAAGIELLVELHHRLREGGGRLTLLRPPTLVQCPLQQVGQDAMSEMMDDGAPADGAHRAARDGTAHR